MQFSDDACLLEASTLLLGAGVGWTGSLALDLIINSFPHEHNSSVLSPHHLPMAGCGVFANDGERKLTTALEVYKMKDQNNLHIMQQRGPIVANHNLSFASDLVKKCKEKKVKEIVLLLSVDSTLRTDEQIEGSQNRVWFSMNHPREAQLQQLKRLEEETKETHFRASAFPSKLIQQCEELEMPLIIFSRFCSEGNNLEDCGVLASSFLGSFLTPDELTSGVTSLKAPPSWEHIRGSPLLRDTAIY